MSQVVTNVLVLSDPVATSVLVLSEPFAHSFFRIPQYIGQVTTNAPALSKPSAVKSLR